MPLEQPFDKQRKTKRYVKKEKQKGKHHSRKNAIQGNKKVFPTVKFCSSRMSDTSSHYSHSSVDSLPSLQRYRKGHQILNNSKHFNRKKVSTWRQNSYSEHKRASLSLSSSVFHKKKIFTPSLSSSSTFDSLPSLEPCRIPLEVGSELPQDDLDDMLGELKLGDEAATFTRKCLILIDFTGTLVAKRKGNQYKKKYKKGERRPDYFVRYNEFFIRPYAREFVATLLNDGRCEVAIYTSQKKKNMEPVVQGFDSFFTQLERQGKYESVSVNGSTITSYSSLYDLSIDIYDQPFNKADPNPDNPYAFMRDLNMIWSSDKIRNLGFNRSNTLMIEATPRKIRNWRENSIVPREYTTIDVYQRYDDQTLKRIAKYLDDKIFPGIQAPKYHTISKILSDNPYSNML